MLARRFERSVLVLNALLSEAPRLGWAAKMDVRSGLVLSVLGIEVSLGIEEHVARVPHVKTSADRRAQRHNEKDWLTPGFQYARIPEYDYLATGELRITAWASGFYASTSWGDTPKRRLEERLAEILKRVVSIAVSSRVRNYDERRRTMAYEAAARKYGEYSERLEREKAGFSQLEAEALQYEQAVRIRTFIAAVRAQYADATEVPADVLEWLDWASQKADWVDPLVQCSDVILDAPAMKEPGRW